MRQIMFRGKREDNGKWVEGNLVYGCVSEYAYIVEFGNKELCRNYVPIIPETIGQFTGLTDKNGMKIFENDVVISATKEKYIVHYQSGAFRLMLGTGMPFLADELNVEVIGNIYDNPIY
jgi:uncharacterized phage protein (TIGR01671 family)